MEEGEGTDTQRALSSYRDTTSLGEGCDELAVPTVFGPTIYLNHVTRTARSPCRRMRWEQGQRDHHAGGWGGTMEGLALPDVWMRRGYCATRRRIMCGDCSPHGGVAPLARPSCSTSPHWHHPDADANVDWWNKDSEITMQEDEVGTRPARSLCRRMRWEQDLVLVLGTGGILSAREDHEAAGVREGGGGTRSRGDHEDPRAVGCGDCSPPHGGSGTTMNEDVPKMISSLPFRRRMDPRHSGGCCGVGAVSSSCDATSEESRQNVPPPQGSTIIRVPKAPKFSPLRTPLSSVSQKRQNFSPSGLHYHPRPKSAWPDENPARPAPRTVWPRYLVREGRILGFDPCWHFQLRADSVERHPSKRGAVLHHQHRHGGESGHHVFGAVDYGDDGPETLQEEDRELRQPIRPQIQNDGIQGGGAEILVAR